MRPADRAWLALGAGVLAWDVLGDEMLSTAAGRYAESRPVLARLIIVYVAAHLLHIIPERCDPLAVLAKISGR